MKKHNIDPRLAAGLAVSYLAPLAIGPAMAYHGASTASAFLGSALAAICLAGYEYLNAATVMPNS